MKTRQSLAAVMLASCVSVVYAQEGVAIPAPVIDQTVYTENKAVAVLAAGCFWGVQGVFQHVKGVYSAVSGYAGGSAANAHYGAVIRGDTGHAESVKITFDPREISYGQILQIYFSVAHDPTQLNRQGPDVGSQYRSVIFPQDVEQAQIAKNYIAQLNAQHVYKAAIVTKIEAETPFYPAEDYHQDYMTRHPTQPYIAFNDLPKVENLKRLFPVRFRSAPLLVAETGL